MREYCLKDSDINKPCQVSRNAKVKHVINAIDAKVKPVINIFKLIKKTYSCVLFSMQVFTVQSL